MEKSIVTKFYVLTLVYKYWLRDMIIDNINKNPHYENLIDLCDTLVKSAADKEDKKWAS